MGRSAWTEIYTCRCTEMERLVSFVEDSIFVRALGNTLSSFLPPLLRGSCG